MDSAAWQNVLLALIAALVTLVAPIIAWYLAQASANSKAAAVVSTAVLAKQEEVVKGNKIIHDTVNSNYQKMQDELAVQRTELKDAMSKLSEATSVIASLTENKRMVEDQAAKQLIVEERKAGVLEGKQIATDAVNIVAPIVSVSAPPNAPEIKPNVA